MARPSKTGLDYFPLDVDIDQDDKVALIEAQHGLIGFSVIIKLMMKIYANGYYYEWGEKEQLLFSKRVNVDINSINVIINDSVKWGLFDNSKYEKSGILTSKGIQKRYLEAISRRQSVEMESNHLCLSKNDLENYKNVVIVDINQVNVDINDYSPEVNDSINPQRKEKKSRVDKSREKNTIIDNDQTDLLWNLYPNKKGKAQAIAKIPKLITKYGYEQMERTITRYCKEIRIKNTASEYIKHGSTFFNSGYVDYLDENYKEENISEYGRYDQPTKGSGKIETRGELPSDYYDFSSIEM